MRATLILSKANGAIIKSTGLQSRQQKEALEPEQDGYRNDEAQKSAEEVAEMAYTFVQAAGAFAGGMQEGDDLQLLRLRTKKNEIVIVPGRTNPVRQALY